MDEYRDALSLELLGARLQAERTDGEATIFTLDTLARELHIQGKFDEAEPLYREALEVSRETLGSRHPDTLGSINTLGLLLKDKGDFVAAELLHREALEGRRETLGSRHPDTLGSMNNLGLLLQAKGDLEDLVAAAPLLREALEGMRETLDRRHPGTLTYYTNNLVKNSTLLVKEYEAAIQDCTSNDQLDQLQADFEAIHLIAELDLNAEMI